MKKFFCIYKFEKIFWGREISFDTLRGEGEKG